MFSTLFYKPIYNGLVILLGILPAWADAGIAVIIFTCLVKLILYPLSYKAVRAQAVMKDVQPEIDAIKAKITDKQAQSLAIFNLYKEKKINPFASIITIVIQIPIIFALFKAFNTGFPSVHADFLYSFVRIPEDASTMFLGLLDITAKSPYWLALVVGVSQFFQARFSFRANQVQAPSQADVSSMQAQLAKNLGFQMQYILPVFTFFISTGFSAALSLYWITSNLFAIGQELYIRKKGSVVVKK